MFHRCRTRKDLCYQGCSISHPWPEPLAATHRLVTSGVSVRSRAHGVITDLMMMFFVLFSEACYFRAWTIGSLWELCPRPVPWDWHNLPINALNLFIFGAMVGEKAHPFQVFSHIFSQICQGDLRASVSQPAHSHQAMRYSDLIYQLGGFLRLWDIFRWNTIFWDDYCYS